MNANFYWKVLLAIVTVGTLWLTYSALSLWIGYIRLDASTKPKSIEWNVHAVSDEVYHIDAHYVFDWKGKEFSGETEFHHDPFRNAWAAEEGIKAYKKHPAYIWFSSSDPTYSSLQKNFPLKECLSAIVLWGLLLYFLGLKYYVNKMKT